MLQKLAPDSVVPLHVDPNNPEYVVLVFPSLERIRLTMIFFSVFLALWIGFLVRGITMREAPNPASGKHLI